MTKLIQVPSSFIYVSFLTLCLGSPFVFCLPLPNFQCPFIWHYLPTVLYSATTTLLPLAHYAHHLVPVQHNHFFYAVYYCWSVLKIEAGGSS